MPTGGASADRLEVPCFRVPLPSRNVDNRTFADGFIVRALSDGLLCPEMPYIALEMPPGAQLFFYCYKPGRSHEDAWARMAGTLPANVHENSCTQCFVPTSVHSSHRCIQCGGFVGCQVCGSVASTSQRSALSRQCRGRGPAGSMGPGKRLAKGRLPRGAVWPSGELCPRPKRLCVTRD